jgi:hypothetical protein
VGQTGLPANINPYFGYGDTVPAVGTVLSLAGPYDFVFDTPRGGKPGPFTFRLWVNDTTPPRARLLPRAAALPRTIRFAVSDAGAGVDPNSIVVKIDGKPSDPTYRRGIVSVKKGVTPGTHHVTLRVSDYQESKNMEDVGPILPNSRILQTTVVVR